MVEFIALLSALGKWLGDHIAAIATLAAAFVALFEEDIVKLWRRPKLTLRLVLKSPDSGAIPTVVMWQEPGDPTLKKWEGAVCYFRLWVPVDAPTCFQVQ